MSQLVEVLSPSTENYDTGIKLSHYQQVESLQEVLFVAHDGCEVTVVRREPDGSWSRHVSTTQAELSSIGCVLSVPDIYRDPLA